MRYFSQGVATILWVTVGVLAGLVVAQFLPFTAREWLFVLCLIGGTGVLVWVNVHAYSSSPKHASLLPAPPVLLPESTLRRESSIPVNPSPTARTTPIMPPRTLTPTEAREWLDALLQQQQKSKKVD